MIDEAQLAWLESEIDNYSRSVETPAEFIVPGDTVTGAAFAFARTIVRRAERRVAELHRVEQFENPAILPYLNRLSSLCFVLELKENPSTGLGGPTLAKD